MCWGCSRLRICTALGAATSPDYTKGCSMKATLILYVKVPIDNPSSKGSKARAMEQKWEMLVENPHGITARFYPYEIEGTKIKATIFI